MINFYFMVGPPPMMDISNVVSTVTFPTLFPASVDFSTVTGAGADNPRNVVFYDPVTVKDRTGADYKPDANGYYKVTTTLTPPEVVFNDTSTEARTWDNIFLYWNGTKWSLTIRPIAKPSTDVDQVATQANVVAVGLDSNARLSDVADPYA